MEYRTLEVNVISATGLNKVNLISKMNVYVVVFIGGSGDKNKQKKKTPANNDGDTNPSWECPMKFTIDEFAARQDLLTLCFKLRCERALGDREIGEVHVPVKELLDSPAGADGRHQYLNYQVRKPNRKAKGQLSFSYKFGEKVDQPLMSYPAGPSSVYPPKSCYPPATAPPYPPPMYEAACPAAMEHSFAASSSRATGYPLYGYVCPPPPPYREYPQPPHGPYGYQSPSPSPYRGYPPLPADHGYGYAPSPGYGYQHVVQPAKPPRNNFGMGLGGALIGGALAGLLLGDVVSDF